MSAYDNRYRDFIEQEIVSGSGAPNDPLVFQYINLNQARIKGIEARLVWNPLAGLDLSAGWANARGHSSNGGIDTPLDTIQPQRLTLAARYEIGALALNAKFQHASAQKASQSSTAANFLPPAFHTLDVGGSFRITPALRASASISNLTNEKYWRWSDVHGIATNSPVLDTYTAPGRQVQLALQADF